jgi:hypothetical protein
MVVVAFLTVPDMLVWMPSSFGGDS